MALGQSVLFDSDSEYEWLLLIQTTPSYKLNSITLGTFIWQNARAEVVAVTKRLYAIEKLDDLVLKVIYDFLENNSHLKREEIAEKPEVFSASLERLMVSAAQVMENLILKNLYHELGLKFEETEGYEFSDYVKELRKKCGR